LHTNTAASSVTRLLDMGVEPFLITSTLNAVLAQRLVRRLCPQCRTATLLSREAIVSLGLNAATMDGMQFFKPHGCSACSNTGFRGRIALFELLEMDDEISRLILIRAEAREVQRAAVSAGMRTMLADGIAKAQAGLTTVEEILRVTREA